jgi:hypothetical protein
MKKFFSGLLIGIALLLFAYLVMFGDTNALLEHAKHLMMGGISASETEGKPEHRYNMSKVCDDPVVELKVHRIFTLHNFSDGYIWIYCRIKVCDETGDLRYFSGAIACWKIHKENGVWEIVEIFERP